MAIANSDGSIVLTTRVVTDGVEQAIKKIKTKFASLKDEKNSLVAITEAIKLQKEQLKRLNDEYTKRVVSGQAGTDALKKEIKEETATLKELEATAATLGKKSTKSFDDMSKGLKNFGKRIAGIVKSALIFSLLYKVMQSVVKLFQNILMSDEEFRQDWEELKAAFYTAAYPIVNLIVPAIKYIVQQVRDWAVSIGKVAAALQGMSYSELVDQAKASKEAADNYADMEKSSKKIADNVKKQLASFDDIQILSSGNKEGQMAGIAGFEGLGQYDTSGEKSMLDDLMKAIGGALVAVGLILLFKGQLAWGIGFIIAGAVAGLFGVAIATLSDESVSQKAKDELSNGMMIVGVIAIVLGILLCMAQQWAWGIGLIAVGVASIVTPIALNWDGIEQQLQGSFGGWLVLGGVIAIVLGILLCFTPMLPLGIGLIVLGVGAIVAPIVANWDAITTVIKDFVVENTEIIALISAGLLLIGILVCFVNLPLGIALIAAGAVGLVTTVVLNWDAIVDIVKEVVEHVAGFFTWLWDGIVAGAKFAFNGVISILNLWIDGFNLLILPIRALVAGVAQAFGQELSLGDVKIPHIPKLAQGAVIPPNREFLAVLGDQKHGTNIEAPLDTIVEAFNIALAQNGGYGNFGGGNTEVVLEIDGREFGRAVVEQGDRENRRIGTRLVIV